MGGRDNGEKVMTKPEGEAPTASEPRNVGTKTRIIVLPAKHPDTDRIAQKYAEERGERSRVDVLLVNPPTPDGGIWIRSQHRVGRRGVSAQQCCDESEDAFRDALS